MKPICSIKGEWCITPTRIWADNGRVVVENVDTIHRFLPPNGMTFEQFMRDYAGCTAPIYFVEEE